MSNFCVAQVEHLNVFIKCEIPFILTGAASAVALRKGLWRDKQGFSERRTWSTPQPASLQAAGAIPRRTPRGAKRAIYGWTLIKKAA
jgi:hypothetical protein